MGIAATKAGFEERWQEPDFKSPPNRVGKQRAYALTRSRITRPSRLSAITSPLPFPRGTPRTNS